MAPLRYLNKNNDCILRGAQGLRQVDLVFHQAPVASVFHHASVARSSYPARPACQYHLACPDIRVSSNLDR